MDSSVVLRRLLNAPGRITSWKTWDASCSSALLEVEVSRAIDRLRLQRALSDTAVSEAHQDFQILAGGMDLIPVSGAVLRRAAQPFPTSLKTLDALHVASALLWQEQVGESLLFLTHDIPQQTAARALGFRVSL